MLQETNEFKTFKIFQELVSKFLNKKFNYVNTSTDVQIKSQLHLSDKMFDFEILSPGEKTLFSYAILFFFMSINSKHNLSESIIIIDEPETHLHPTAQILLIESLKKIINNNGQLWIATHSLPIISILKIEEIFVMENSKIITPSRDIISKALFELMNFENHIYQLGNLLGSISTWAYTNFMEQCLMNPESIFSTSQKDPQYKLLIEQFQAKGNVEILDYGAGKGRIGYMLKADSEMKDRVQYSAYCYDENDRLFLENVPNIAEIYMDESEFEKGKFDLVLLVNVLHEIHVDDWIAVLINAKKTLNKNGFLLIMEDKFLPKGEKANEFGYLILDTDSMRILLNSKTVIKGISEFQSYKKRLECGVFFKSQINPTKESLMKSLEDLKEKKKKSIKKLRELESSLVNGRLYANESQLYINSILAIEELQKKK